MSKSQMIHSKILQKVSSEAKLNNDIVAEKMVEIKEKKVRDEYDYINEYEKQQKAVRKKLKLAYEIAEYAYEEAKA